MEHFHERKTNPRPQSVREVFHHRQCPDRHEGEDYEPITTISGSQWPDMDVTRMDQSETIQMFKSKLRFQIRSRVFVESSKSSHFWFEARRLPPENKSGGGGYTEHPQLVQQVNLQWLVSEESSLNYSSFSSALTGSSWTTSARTSEAPTAAQSGGLSPLVSLVPSSTVYLKSIFQIFQVSHSIQKPSASHWKYWHCCGIWDQVRVLTCRICPM